MAIRAAAGLVAEWFTPTDEVGEDSPTRFKLRPLNQLAFMEIATSGTSREDGAFLPSHQGRLLLLKHGLVDWENFTDAASLPVPFTSANFDRIPMQILIEITTELVVRSVLSDEEKKT